VVNSPEEQEALLPLPRDVFFPGYLQIISKVLVQSKGSGQALILVRGFYDVDVVRRFEGSQVRGSL